MPVWGKSCCFMSERLSPVFTLACISAGVSGTLFKDIFLGRQAQTASMVKLLKEITVSFVIVYSCIIAFFFTTSKKLVDVDFLTVVCRI